MTDEKTRTLEDFGILLAVPQCIHPKEKRYPEIKEPGKIQQVIIDHIKTNCRFERASVPGLAEPPRGRLGTLRTEFQLSTVKKLCGNVLDEPIIEAINDLVGSGRLIILHAGIRKFMRPTDLYFDCEFATCMKSNYPREEYDILRFYPLEPLSQTEIKKRSAVILDVTAHIQKIRERRDAYFRQEHGDRGNEIEIEKQIRAEERAVRIEEHKALMANLNKNKAPEQPDIKI